MAGYYAGSLRLSTSRIRPLLNLRPLSPGWLEGEAGEGAMFQG